MTASLKELNKKRARRHARVRAGIFGTAERPRLSVFRSNKGEYLQLIDDVSGTTLAAAVSGEVSKTVKGGKSDSAKALGKLLAERAVKLGIKKAVFDRGSYRYHGRVKAVAEGAKDGGLTV